MFKLKMEQQIFEDLLVLYIHGQLDAITADDLAAGTEHLKSRQVKYVVIDFKDITLIDSSGVGAVVSILKHTRNLGGDTVLVNVGGQPKEVLKILNLHKAVRIFDGMDKAFSSIGRTNPANGSRSLSA